MLLVFRKETNRSETVQVLVISEGDYVWRSFIINTFFVTSLLLSYFHVFIENVPPEVFRADSSCLGPSYHFLRNTAHVEATYLIFKRYCRVGVTFALKIQVPLTVSKVITDLVHAWARVYARRGDQRRYSVFVHFVFVKEHLTENVGAVTDRLLKLFYF